MPEPLPAENIHPPVQRFIIEAGRTEQHYWADLWRFRELFFILAWRDVMVRYKQTVAGVGWAILRPLLTMIVFTVIFGKLGKFPSPPGVPYMLLVGAAQLPWQFFSNSLSGSGGSLVANSALISRIYFPRLIIPAGSVVVSLIDFLITFIILAGIMVWYQFAPSPRILLLPFFVVLAFLAALGPGLLLTALTVRYRDFIFITPFIVQFGLYISPVGFSSDFVREHCSNAVFLLYSLNPMVGVIEGFRWCILGGSVSIYWPGFLISLFIVALFLWSGIWYFRKTEKTFADVI